MSMTDVNFNPMTEAESEKLWDSCREQAVHLVLAQWSSSLLQALVEEEPSIELLVSSVLSPKTDDCTTLDVVKEIRAKILKTDYAKDLIRSQTTQLYNSERFWR